MMALLVRDRQEVRGVRRQRLLAVEFLEFKPERNAFVLASEEEGRPTGAPRQPQTDAANATPTQGIPLLSR
jgi:hypothetical protein